jgi:hypothetical protein
MWQKRNIEYWRRNHACSRAILSYEGGITIAEEECWDLKEESWFQKKNIEMWRRNHDSTKIWWRIMMAEGEQWGGSSIFSNFDREYRIEMWEVVTTANSNPEDRRLGSKVIPDERKYCNNRVK